jgi:hypothetical protein
MAFEVSRDRLLTYVLLADEGIDFVHTLRKGRDSRGTAGGP